MSGHEPKRHHFVQRAYLDGFTDPRSNGIWRYIVGRVPAISGTEEVAVQNYYYCHEENGERKFIGEHGLGKLEGLAMPMLKQMRTHNFTLNNDDRLTFAGYIATAHTRVPSFERSLNSTNAFMHAKG